MYTFVGAGKWRDTDYSLEIWEDSFWYLITRLRVKLNYVKMGCNVGPQILLWSFVFEATVTSLNTPPHCLISHSEALWWRRLFFWYPDEVRRTWASCLALYSTLIVFHVEADADAAVVNVVGWEEMDLKTQLIGLVHEHLGWEGGEQQRSGRGRNTLHRSKPSTPKLYLMSVTLLGHNAPLGNFSFHPLRSPDFTNHSL